MMLIEFPDRETEIKGLAILMSGFSGRVLRGGFHIVPEPALEALNAQKIASRRLRTERLAAQAYDVPLRIEPNRPLPDPSRRHDPNDAAARRREPTEQRGHVEVRRENVAVPNDDVPRPERDRRIRDAACRTEDRRLVQDVNVGA